MCFPKVNSFIQSLLQLLELVNLFILVLDLNLKSTTLVLPSTHHLVALLHVVIFLSDLLLEDGIFLAFHISSLIAFELPKLLLHALEVVAQLLRC